MSISTVQPLGILVAAGPWIVGATFLWAGVIKALEPHVFHAHLIKLGWIPARHANNSVIVAAGLEAGWGTALILGVAPGIVLPATAVALAALTAVSWWGVKTGRTTDCGCYGGYVVPSLAQSIGLNAAFIALTVVAWVARGPAGPTPGWKLLATVGIGIITAGLAATALHILNTKGRSMVELSPLKVGRAWRARWGAGFGVSGGEHIVSYLGPDCPHCKQWVRVLNAISQAPELPRVVGVVATSNEKLDAFVETSGIRFPMRTIPQTLMNRLVWGVPTTILVSEGKIQDQWSGRMPPEFFQRFKDAFFPSAAAVTANGAETAADAGPVRST
jgi:hypothetical protein